MTMMTDTTTSITVGVDTHAEIHVAAALDQVGGVIDVASFATTADGYRDLLGRARRHGTITAFGIDP